MVNHAAAQHADAASSGASTLDANSPGAATAMNIGTVEMNAAAVRTFRTGDRGDVAYQTAIPVSAIANDGCSAL